MAEEIGVFEEEIRDVRCFNNKPSIEFFFAQFELGKLGSGPDVVKSFGTLSLAADEYVTFYNTVLPHKSLPRTTLRPAAIGAGVWIVKEPKRTVNPAPPVGAKSGGSLTP